MIAAISGLVSGIVSLLQPEFIYFYWTDYPSNGRCCSHRCRWAPGLHLRHPTLAAFHLDGLTGILGCTYRNHLLAHLHTGLVGATIVLAEIHVVLVIGLFLTLSGSTPVRTLQYGCDNLNHF